MYIRGVIGWMISASFEYLISSNLNSWFSVFDTTPQITAIKYIGAGRPAGQLKWQSL
jgi:hypothetical protein